MMETEPREKRSDNVIGAVNNNEPAKNIDAQLEAALKIIAEQVDTIASLQSTLHAVKQSTSWRVTAPLRLIRTLFNKLLYVLSEPTVIIRNKGGLISVSKKALTVLRRDGLRVLIYRAKILLVTGGRSIDPDGGGRGFNPNDYSEWILRYDTLTPENRGQIKSALENMLSLPKISIVMPVYDPPLQFLEEAIQSIQAQLYPNWQLCIADDNSKNPKVKELLAKYESDDERINVVFRAENGHISKASNSAIELATGDYIALVDNDDILPEHALYFVADAINRHPGVGIIYSDEDKISLTGQRIDPYFKSDWNPELFLGQNMISHLGVYRADLVRLVGGFRAGYEGSQDYDLAARIIEKIEPWQIHHIPRVLYHWRILPGSTALSTGEKPYALVASEKTLNEYLLRRNIAARVRSHPIGLHHVTFSLPAMSPLVSIVIPSKNAKVLLEECITSIFALTQYENFEVILVDNGSDDRETLEYIKELEKQYDNFTTVRYDCPFNFAALVNKGVQHSRGDVVVLLNNDTKIVSPNWLSEMTSIALQPDVGAVGACLWYPDGRLQHGGVTLGLGASQVAGHTHHNMPKGHYGYFGKAFLTQEVSAVTAACLAVSKKKYQEIGGFNEIDLTVAFNDVDFCLRLRVAGYRNIWTPHAELIHFESATRGDDFNPKRIARFKDETAYMKKRWGALLVDDPNYNPNLSLTREDFSLAWPPRTRSLKTT